MGVRRWRLPYPLFLSAILTLLGVHMSKVKPYIITVQYIGVYSDPPPTEEQILNELNIDVINLTIAPMIVNGKELQAEINEEAPAPVKEAVVKTPVVIPVEPRKVGKASNLELKKRNLLPFSTADLDVNGPSVKILAALYKEPMTGTQLREATKLEQGPLATSLSRLKHKGRVTAVSYSPKNGTTYQFVK